MRDVPKNLEFSSEQGCFRASAHVVAELPLRLRNSRSSRLHRGRNANERKRALRQGPWAYGLSFFGQAATTAAPIFPRLTWASLSTNHRMSVFCLVNPHATTRD